MEGSEKRTRRERRRKCRVPFHSWIAAILSSIMDWFIDASPSPAPSVTKRGEIDLFFRSNGSGERFSCVPYLSMYD